MPNCFMAAWDEANYLHPGLRHNPRFLFLPLLPETKNYGESLFAANEADLSADILVAEFEPSESAGKLWRIERYYDLNI